MYKAISLPLLAVALLGVTLRSSDATPAALATPVVVARVSLTDQNAPIPTTVIFTPRQTGLYRISPYMSATNGPINGYWNFDFFWTDEGGTRNATTMLVLNSDYGKDQTNGLVVGSFSFRAIAGQPVSYDVSGCCGVSGTYELSLVVERLM